MNASGWADSGLDFQGLRVKDRARRAVRAAALDLMALVSKTEAPRQPGRVHFVYSHHVFADEVDGYRELMAGLANDYRFIPYSDGVRRLREGGLDGVFATVSFDDGLRNNVRAAEILRDLGISACFFVCPGVVGRSDEASIRAFCRRLNGPPCEVLNWEELGRMMEMGHEVGGHTVNHANLGAVDPGQARDEIWGCREELVRRLGASAGKHFAWPYGTFNHITADAAREVYRSGFVSCTSAVRGAHGAELRGKATPCLRREHVIGNWPLRHARYFLNRSARRIGPASGDWPSGWEQTIRAN